MTGRAPGPFFSEEASELTFFQLIAVAVALAMDALAVSIATGVSLDGADARQTFRLVWHFAFFQSLMTFLGWAAGTTIAGLVSDYSRWVAFGLLLLIGGRMVWHGLRPAGEETTTKDPTRGLSLLLLSVATSIDALAVGVSLGLLDVSPAVPLVIIGLVAGLFTFAGLRLGGWFCGRFNLGRWAGVIGGGVLALIGLWILLG